MKLNNHVKQRFVSDQKLPIQVFDDPYFDYFLDLYDEDFKTKEKYEMLLNTLFKYNSQEAFLEDFYKIRDNIIESLKSTEAYKRFINEKNPDFVKTKDSTPKFDTISEIAGIKFSKKSDVYSPANVNKCFLSIDLKKANFQVLKKYDKNIVFGANTYEEMLEKFTDLEYIKSSKYIREVIFGCINTGRQVAMQRYYTAKLLEWLIDNKIVNSEDVYVFTNDEIVIYMSNEMSPEKCEELKVKINKCLDLEVSVEYFCLKMIGEKDYFVKELNTGEIKFKAIPAAYYPQIYKKYKGLPLNDNDLLFYFEKRLAKFINPLF